MKINQRNPRHLFLLLFFVFLLSIPVAASGENLPSSQGWMEWGDSYWPERPVGGGTIRVAAPMYIGLFNPNHFPVMDWSTMGFFYDKLILHDGSYKPTIPWLAESWQYLDTLTVMMKLKQGVQFQDGSDFTAGTLKYQIEWILDKKNGAWSRPWLEPLQSIEIVDTHTLKFHLKRPWGACAGTMASVPGMVISEKALKLDTARAEKKDIVRKLGSVRRKAEKAESRAESSDASALEKEDAIQARKEYSILESRMKELESLAQKGKSVDSMPAGTGSYFLAKASPGNYIELKRNPNWWFGKHVGIPAMPYYDSIKVSVIPDPSVRLASLKAGKVDYTLLNPFQYRIIKNDPRFHVGISPLNWLVWLMMNQAEGPCKDIRVRKAISHAIDRKALVMGTQAGMGRLASCIFPDNHWTHNPDLEPVKFDPDLSRKLLAEAGYKNGLTIKGFTLNTPTAQSFAKAVMAMLGKVGIKWDVDFLGIAGMVTPFMKRDYDMSGGLYQWIFEPDLIATALYMPDGMLNYGRNKNEKAIDLIMKGREEVDDAKRIKIYQQLEAVLYENYEDVWLWYPNMVTASSKRIQGFNVEMLKQYGEGYFRSHPTWFKAGGMQN
jgi:peptide/nickel transport system substrate-binding protein